MKTIQIKRIDPISASKMVLAIYALGVVVMLGVDALRQALRGGDAISLARGIPMVALMVVMASLGTLLICLAYNLIALKLGGIRVTIEESTDASSGTRGLSEKKDGHAQPTH